MRGGARSSSPFAEYAVYSFEEELPLRKSRHTARVAIAVCAFLLLPMIAGEIVSNQHHNLFQGRHAAAQLTANAGGARHNTKQHATQPQQQQQQQHLHIMRQAGSAQQGASSGSTQSSGIALLLAALTSSSQPAAAVAHKGCAGASGGGLLNLWGTFTAPSRGNTGCAKHT